MSWVFIWGWEEAKAKGQEHLEYGCPRACLEKEGAPLGKVVKAGSASPNLVHTVPAVSPSGRYKSETPSFEGKKIPN